MAAQLNALNVWEQEKSMPEYAFKCRFCDYICTTWKNFTQEMIYPICPNCDTQMIRDYRIAGVHFKGNGWGGDK